MRPCGRTRPAAAQRDPSIAAAALELGRAEVRLDRRVELHHATARSAARRAARQRRSALGPRPDAGAARRRRDRRDERCDRAHATARGNRSIARGVAARARSGRIQRSSRRRASPLSATVTCWRVSCDEVVRRNRRRVRERLVVVPHQVREDLDGVRPDDELVVVGAVAPRHQAGVRRARRNFFSSKPIENVLTGPRPELRHQRDDGARVDAAAEKRAERHVADEPQPRGFAQLVAGVSAQASASLTPALRRVASAASSVRS